MQGLQGCHKALKILICLRDAKVVVPKLDIHEYTMMCVDIYVRNHLSQPPTSLILTIGHHTYGQHKK